jgi:hypothetical protein
LESDEPVRQLAERVWFALARVIGRLLRASRYAEVRIVAADATCEVRKRRRFYAPALIRMGDVLVGILNTGVRVLAQREWEARERLLYRSLGREPVRAQGDGTLVLPCLRGRTLASVLDERELEPGVRANAVEAAVDALRRLHRLGYTHGDAMAENVLVELDAGVAHWFDFETLHEPHRPLAWRRADDVRALLATTLLRTGRGELAGTLERILDRYADPAVDGLVAASFTPVLRRPLPFHLGQAGLSFRTFRDIGRLLEARSP